MSKIIRLNIVVEGQTEENFVKRVLQEELSKKNIFAYPRLVSNRNVQKRKFKGGMVSYLKAKNDILRWMKEDQNPEAWFTTMFDYYALPDDFPGYEQLNNDLDPYQKVKLLEDEFKSDIGGDKFIPYLQLHEFESLLFVDPSQLAKHYFEYPDKTSDLESVLNRFSGNPELINDGITTAPSKRITAYYPNYQKEKPIAGNLVASATGISSLRRCCKHFDEWLTKLESLSIS